jgi:hypothetical protein
MSTHHPEILTDQSYVLEKFPGKGGWTYAAIPEIRPDKKAWFNWVKVRGYIDDFYIEKYHLMPIGDGRMMLPVKAAIRKKINKQAGDCVHIKLYRDQEPTDIPQEFLDCLADDEVAMSFFSGLTSAEQKVYTDWIYSGKNADEREHRMAMGIDMLASGQRRPSE